MRFVWICVLLSLVPVAGAGADRPFKYGDFERWTVRYIKESFLLGGKTRALYEIASSDTIRGNVPFSSRAAGTPWTTSNSYASVFGVEKASVSVRPERRGDGYCCRLDCKLDTVTAVGIPLKVLVAGSVFTGESLEPVGMRSDDEVMSMFDMGVPFTGRPSALVLDYKARVADTGVLVYAAASKSVRYTRGGDGPELFVLLQRRWEEPDGTLHAERCGTAWERVERGTDGWVNDHVIPIRWGDITRQPGYHDYERLQPANFMARNSKGRMTWIVEEGYTTANPTHIIVFLSAGWNPAFTGCPGNTLWVDNIRLRY